MPKPMGSRKSRFRAALALAQLTAVEWATEQDVTAGHLSHVLSGRRESVVLNEKIDGFIRKMLRDTVAA